jgi:hypothetical protein
MTLLTEVKRNNRQWFSPANRSFFDDKRYTVRRGQVTHNAFLVRKSEQWSSMFGKPVCTYRLNVLTYDKGWHIGAMLDQQFATFHQVMQYLKTA